MAEHRAQGHDRGKDHLMINLLRWVAALPLGLIASFAAYMIIDFNFSVIYGYEKVALFWQAHDMAGMPITGSFIMLVTRVLQACALVSVAALVVPQFKKQVGFYLAIIASILSVALVSYLFYRVYTSGLALGFSGWYRGILETTSLIVGCVVGAGASSRMGSAKTANQEE